MVLNFGPGCILLLLIACFITFYVRRALQQKQQPCIIYVMRCHSLLMKTVDEFQSEIQISNVCKSNSNFKTEVQKFKLRLTSLTVSVHYFVTTVTQ